MRKGLISLLLIPALLLAGCAGNPLERTYDKEAAYSRPEQELPADIPPVDNTTPVDPNKDPIDIHSVAEKFFIDGSTPYTLADIAAGIGILSLRKTEAGALYSIHPVQQGGRLLIFYDNYDDTQNYRNQIKQWFYVNKPLSYEDFESIKEGDTIEDVINVDPSEQIFKNIFGVDPKYYDEQGGFQSWHYLSDGVLELGYKIENGKLVLIATQFSENFNVPRYYDAVVNYYDGHLLPIDALDTWKS